MNNAFDIESFLTERASKETIGSVCQQILKDQFLLDELFDLIFHGSAKLQWRAAWAFEHVYLLNPQVVTKYLPTILESFHFLPNTGVRRHLTKILSLVNVSDMVDGNFINTCFDWIRSEEVPVAVKVYCMELLFQVVQKYPDLKEELKITIETYMPHNSAGFKSRGKKILAKL